MNNNNSIFVFILLLLLFILLKGKFIKRGKYQQQIKLVL